MTRVKAVGALALVVMSLTSVRVGAESRSSSPPKQWLRTDSHRQIGASSLSSGGGLGKVAAVTLLLAVGGYAAWRRTRKGQAGVAPIKTHIRVVGGTLVGPKARAVVAEVGGRLILLGVTESSVRKLAWLDGVNDVDLEKESEPRASGNPSNASDNPSTQYLRSSRQVNVPYKPSARRSKFSEVLRDAVGIKSRALADPALVLAQSTRDRLNLTIARHQTKNDSPLIEVEGQVAGLVTRLDRPK